MTTLRLTLHLFGPPFPLKSCAIFSLYFTVSIKTAKTGNVATKILPLFIQRILITVFLTRLLEHIPIITKDYLT